MLFDSDPGIVSICGAIAALGGMSVYTVLNMKEPREKSTIEQPPKLPSVKLKNAGEGNKEDSKPEYDEYPPTPV